LAVAFSGYRGRDRAGRSRDVQRISAPKAPEWPPLFDSNGSKYIFDNRSEMFYEPTSDYFYDPKSKLYYSNQKKAYFRYDESKVPAFELITSSYSPANDDASVESSESNTVKSGASKKSITISIKSTASSLAGSTLRSIDARAFDCNRTKVSESSSETKERHLVTAREAASAGQTMNEIVVIKEKPLKTSSGLPICALCRRKFPSMEILQRHEQHSELHKMNMMKAAKSTIPTKVKPEGKPEGKPKEDPVVYEDRASKRRKMHGDTSTVEPPRPMSFVLKESVCAAPVEPAAVLGQANVGHQLFKKMMSKSKPLGDVDVPVKGSMEDFLRKDWERIEEMSQNGGSSRDGKAGLSSASYRK
jgi:hypothetical protein